MDDRQIRLADKFGITEKIKALEEELLNIQNVAFDKSANGVCFDLDGYDLSEHYKQVVIVPEYDIDVRLNNYYEVRRTMLDSILSACEKHNLVRTGDRIEDYGKHFYIVLKEKIV